MKKAPPEIEHLILRHYLVDRWPIGTVARQVGVHHGVVRRILLQHGQAPVVTQQRARKSDPYIPFIERTLIKYPKLHASRLYQMVRQRGFDGSEPHFRRIIAELRPRPTPEAFARLDMLPGEQAQVDWGHFGTVDVGRARRPLFAFVMTLSWSRMIWLQFFHDMQMANFLRGHIDAFDFYSGVARRLLYDNLKSAVVERYGSAIRFNEKLLQFASHYGYEPIAAAPRRGNEKGRVERAIRYIRTSFFAAREFSDIDDLNRQAVLWSRDLSASRKWPDDDRKRVGEQFEQEKSQLLPLPDAPFDACERLPVKVGRTPYVRFDTNDYSVPAEHVRREVTVLADHRRLRISVDGDIVAEHLRSYDRRTTIVDPEHTKRLREFKRRARQGAATHRLTRAAPSATVMLQRAAEQGQNLGSLVSRLLTLLEIYGAQALDTAIGEANQSERVGAKPVRLALERRARSQGRTPPMPIVLHDEALREVTVEPTDLSRYDHLSEDDDGDNS